MKNCVVCGKEFKPRSKTTKFCSSWCYGRSKATDPDPILKLWEDGLSAYAISEQTRVGYHSVQRVLKAAGVFEKRYIRKQRTPPTGVSANTYRDRALAHYGAKCSVCGYGKYEKVLQVNHCDGDRHNNDMKNLQVLCPTCHVEYHWLNRTGWFAPKRQSYK